MRKQIHEITFIHVCSILLIGLTNACTPPLAVKPKYWFDLPDGREIAYQPVDSLLVVEFSDTLSSTGKRQIIKDLDLEFLPIQVRNNQDVQDIGKASLVLGMSARNYDSIKDQISRNYHSEFRGVLPAFELDKRLCYLRPVTFGISFYGEVHQDSVFALLQKYELTFHDRDKIKANPYPFYVIRMAYVDIKSHSNLFEIIRRISREPEVYSTFPLFVESGYALVHGPSPIAMRQKLIRNEPFFLTKVEQQLKMLYWVWKTAELDIVKELAQRSAITTSNDSVKVTVTFRENKIDLIRELLAEHGVRLIYPIKKLSGRLTAVAFLPWQSFESFARSDYVSYIAATRTDAVKDFLL